MSNIFTTIGHDVKVGAEDVAKGVEAAVKFAIVHPVEFLTNTEKVLQTAITDTPAVKTAIQNLIAAAVKVIGDLDTAVLADKGINLPADVQAVTDAETFFVYFKNTFIPAIEGVYTDLKKQTAA